MDAEHLNLLNPAMLSHQAGGKIFLGGINEECQEYVILAESVKHRHHSSCPLKSSRHLYWEVPIQEVDNTFCDSGRSIISYCMGECSNKLFMYFTKKILWTV